MKTNEEKDFSSELPFSSIAFSKNVMHGRPLPPSDDIAVAQVMLNILRWKFVSCHLDTGITQHYVQSQIPFAAYNCVNADLSSSDRENQSMLIT